MIAKENDCKKSNVFLTVWYKLCSFCAYLAKLAKNSKTSELLLKAAHLNDSLRDPSSSLVSKKLSGSRYREKVSRPVKKAVAYEIENSTIIQWMSAKISSLLCLRVRSFGSLLFSFGFFSILGKLITNVIATGNPFSFDGMIAGAVLIASSLPLLFSGMGTLASEICESKVFSFVFFSIFGLYREDFEDKDENGSEASIAAFLVGMLLGVISLVIPAKYILAALSAIVVAIIVIDKPESGVVFTFIALPFIRTTYLIAIIMLCSFSYIIKLLRGQRSLKIDVADGAVLLFALLLFFGGLFSAGGKESMKAALVYICFIAGYFLVVNLIRTREWIIRSVGALISGLLIESLIGVCEYLLGFSKLNWFDTSLFSGIEGRAVATFENPNVLGEYIVLALPLAMALVARTGKPYRRIGSLIICICAAACAVFTWSRGAWIALAVCCGMMLVMISEKFIMLLLVAAVALPFARFWMPSNVFERLMSIGSLADSSSAYRLSVWRGSLSLASDHLLSGIGIGSSAFGTVYPSYAYSGCETALHSHNLFIQLVVEMGIPALILFLFIVFMWIARSAGAMKNCHRRSPLVRLISFGCISAIIGLLVQGMTDYVFYSYRIYLLFFMIAGLLGSCTRFIKNEDSVLPEWQTGESSSSNFDTELHYESVNISKESAFPARKQPSAKNDRKREFPRMSAGEILRLEEEAYLRREVANARQNNPKQPKGDENDD